MGTFTAAAAALLALAAVSAAAEAASSPRAEPDPRLQRFAETGGRTLPPVGYVRFCARQPHECRPPARHAAARMQMTRERWRQAWQVNSHVNAKVAPISDQELYGQAEYWTYPAEAGDCEDYTLLKKRMLERLGFARSALLITVVRDERNDGHAVLMLRTTDGDFILDNRRDEVSRWSDLGYTYLKRQSAANPRDWVSLGSGGAHRSAALTTGDAAAR